MTSFRLPPALRAELEPLPYEVRPGKRHMHVMVRGAIVLVLPRTTRPDTPGRQLRNNVAAVRRWKANHPIG